MPDEPQTEVTTFGSHAKREMPDGTLVVGYVPKIVAPRGLALPHRQIEFLPVLLPESVLKELLDQQRARDRNLILLGQVIIVPES
jgi:hypothetical protein